MERPTTAKYQHASTFCWAKSPQFLTSSPSSPSIGCWWFSLAGNRFSRCSIKKNVNSCWPLAPGIGSLLKGIRLTKRIEVAHEVMHCWMQFLKNNSGFSRRNVKIDLVAAKHHANCMELCSTPADEVGFQNEIFWMGKVSQRNVLHLKPSIASRDMDFIRKLTQHFSCLILVVKGINCHKSWAPCCKTCHVWNKE